MGQERAREADLEPAAGDRVKHADLARQLERMVEDGEHGSGNEAGFLAAHRGRSQEYDRVWAVAAIRVEIVFDRTDVRVAEFVAYRDQIERLLPIILSGLFGRPYVGKELNTEVHLLREPLVVPQNLIRSKFTEQRISVVQIASVEILGETAVDFGEHRLRFVAATCVWRITDFSTQISSSPHTGYRGGFRPCDAANHPQILV